MTDDRLLVCGENVRCFPLDNGTFQGKLQGSMFDELSSKLEATFAKLRGRGTLSEADIKDGLRDVRRVLLEADVNFQLTGEFLERVTKRAVGVSQLRTVSPAQQLVKIVFDELTAMLGERREGLKLSSVPPTVVMMVGLQGSGKTTTAAKLARRLKAEGRQVRMIAGDVYRPAAIDQLETLGGELGIREGGRWPSSSNGRRRESRRTGANRASGHRSW